MDSPETPSILRKRPGYLSRPTSPAGFYPPSRPSAAPPSRYHRIPSPLAQSSNLNSPTSPSAPPLTPSRTVTIFSRSGFPILIISVLLVIPALIRISATFGGSRQVPAAVARAGVVTLSWGNNWTKHYNIKEKRRLWRKQSIADKSIQSDQYNWGGKGSGAEICKRWSHQSALLGDTLYIYGGQATTDAEQESNRWNSNFVALSLRDNWDIGTPPVAAISGKEAGTPPVANGYLFSSTTEPNDPMLYLYGGLVPDNPYVLPPPNSMWVYSLKSRKWSEVKDSSFIISDDTKQKYIERAAEGAGASIPERGLGFYFGGHLDGYTTQRWDQSTPRVYLNSLLELRFPRGTEAHISAGHIGFRNVSEGSGLDKAGVPERADGVLVFVPWGPKGLLIGIGGGRNDTFSQLNIVDVYDLSSSKWYKQSTSGPTPQYRVNPCAALGSAPDGTSHNIYVYGGQNLVPYKQQVQYDDIWILSVPSFTWIAVDLEGKYNPPARAGHTCDILGKQIVVVGGYVTADLSCDSPGIYVFDATSLQWQTVWKGTSSGGGGGDNSKATNLPDELIYKVPKVVYEQIGGNENGGATITKPVRTPDSDSPLITGNPTYTYSHPGYTMTVTRSDGSVVTQTGLGLGAGPSQSGKKGPNVLLIIAAVVGGIAGLVLLLLLSLFVLYRSKIRQLRERSRITWEQNIRRSGGRLEATATSSGTGPTGERQSEERRSTDELFEIMQGREPSFWGMILAPRRSLRVVNLS